MTTGQNNSDSKGFNRSDEGNLVKTAGTFRVFSMLWDWCQDKQVPCHLLITCARDRILVGSPRILTVGNHSHQSNYEHVMREHWAPSGENLQSVTPHFDPLNQTSVSTSWTLFNSVKKKKKRLKAHRCQRTNSRACWYPEVPWSSWMLGFYPGNRDHCSGHTTRSGHSLDSSAPCLRQEYVRSPCWWGVMAVVF